MQPESQVGPRVRQLSGAKSGRDGHHVPSLTVLVPCFNEAAVIDLFHRRLSAALDAMPVEARVLYVDDGSRDGTLARLAALAESDPRVAVLALSRNFGKEIAMSAGLDHVDADACVLIDADL